MLEEIATRDVSMFQQLLEPMIEIVENRPTLSLGWYIDHRWAVVPIEQYPIFITNPPTFFTERSAEWLTEAAAVLNCSDAYAIPLSSDAATCSAVFRVPMQQEALLEFSRLCGGSEYVVMPEDRSFCVLLTNRGYNLIAGPREFAQKAVGSSITAARLEFQETTDAYLESVPYEAQAPWYEEWDRVSRRYFVEDGVIGHLYDHPEQILLDVEAMTLPDTWRFNPAWAKARHWSVVPVFKEGHFNTQEQEWLLKAAQAVQSKSLLVVDLNGTMTNRNEVYELPVSADAIAYFTKTYSVTSCVVMTNPMQLAILCFLGEYKLVAGLSEVVRIALGCSIPTARAMFLNRYASEYTWDEQWQEYLLRLSQTYANT